MKKRNFYIYLSIFCIHLLLLLVAFVRFRIHPHDIWFCNYGDGLKNIYTLVAFVREPISSAGIFKFYSYGYPYGEYVYYTDNTPFFSVPFRFFCQHIYDLSGYTVEIFNLFIISNIILCGLIIYRVFSYLLQERLFSFIMAIILPWDNMQVMRIWRGHYNLSLSSIVVLAIALMILWHRYAENRKKQIVTGVAMFLLSFFSFTVHGYFLAIVSSFLFFSMFIYGLLRRREARGKFSIIASFVYVFLSFAASYIFVALTDSYLPLRREAANGYDWMEQKTHFASLFSHYDFQHFAFPISEVPDISDPERAAYLGNIGLFAVVIIFIAALIKKEFRRQVIEIQKNFFRDPLKVSILIASVLMLSMSLGENYYTAVPYESGYHIVNVLNPLFYVHLFTVRVEQFRSIERFVWPFFFAFNIWIAYTIVAIFKGARKSVKIFMLSGVIIFGGMEVKEFIDKIQGAAARENLFSSKSLAEVRPPHINYKRYQAILPIPYYFSGSEDYDYTIDPYDQWFKYGLRLSIDSYLPLMSCAMSRLPPKHGTAMLYLVAYDSMDTQLRNMFNEKPVLVAVNKKQIVDSNLPNIPKFEIANRFYWKATQFAARNNLHAVDSLGDVIYYDWYPNPAVKK